MQNTHIVLPYVLLYLPDYLDRLIVPSYLDGLIVILYLDSQTIM